MWAPLSALILVIGIASTPGMIEAERDYLRQQEGVIEVDEIETTASDATDATRVAEE
jgi:hypothetical protein